MDLSKVQEYNERCIKEFCQDFFDAFGETPGECWERSEKEGKEFWGNLKQGDTLNFKAVK